MKKIIRTLAVVFTIFTALTTSASIFGAKKITVHVIPEEAKIYRDNMEVGEGVYTIEFKGVDFVTLKLVAPGYEDRRVTVRKDNPKKDILFKLDQDEAMANSIGANDPGSDGRELANKAFEVTCRKGMTEDVIWKRLINIATNYFEDLEVRDKAAGWIKSAWNVTHFKNSDVRTRLEIRLSFTDGETPSYRVKLVSEKKPAKADNNAYRKYDRLMKQFEPLVTELSTSLGSNL